MGDYNYNYDYAYSADGQYYEGEGGEEQHGLFHKVSYNGLEFKVDEYGRVVDDERLIPQDPNLPEDITTFLSGWQKQRMASTLDAADSSRKQENTVSCPLCHLVDLFQEGRMSRVIELEKATPPLRSRFRPATERNRRDICTWIEVERLNAFVESNGIPGTQEYYIDWTDGPDRYLMSDCREPRPGWRRLWHFAGYPVSQYYIIERDIEHPVLTGEGGKSKAYSIVKGLSVFARKNWRLIGSFFAFDKHVPSSNKYTIYTREDPFHRMLVTMDVIDHAHEWHEQFSFYAFDIPIPGSCVYELHHCVRSIHTTDASVGRHRLTTENSKLPWQFRMYVYVYPALPEDCTITDECDNYLENPYAV